MNKLREAENRVFKTVVEPVDEDEHLPFGRLFDKPRERGDGLLLVDDIGFQGYELGRRIAGNLFRPLNVAGLARPIRGN